MTLPATFKPYGSSNNEDYLPELEQLCDRLGYRVRAGRWECTRRLANPLHRCTRCPRLGAFHEASVLDHVVRLEATDGSHVALLSQLYNLDATALDRFVDRSGAARWDSLGPAPYGHGTVAALIVGQPRKDTP